MIARTFLLIPWLALSISCQEKPVAGIDDASPDSSEVVETAKPDPTKPETFVGLTIEAAQDAAKEADVPHRIIEVDGEPRPATMDHRPGKTQFRHRKRQSRPCYQRLTSAE